MGVAHQRIPLVQGAPLVGSLRPLITDVGRFLTRLYLQLGPVFRISVLGQRLTVLAGPEANALMKSDGHRLFSSRHTMRGIHQVLGGENPTMIELDGADHRTVRSGLKEGYSGASLFSQMPRLVASQLDLIGRWPRGEPFPVFTQIKRLVSSLLGYLATNRTPGAVMDDLIYLFRAMVEIHIRRVRPGIFQYLPRYVRSRQAVLAMAKAIWEQRTGDEGLAGDRDFVDLVRNFHTAHPRLMSEKDAMAAIVGPFIAGLDTAASTTSFLLFHILKDAALNRRITTEADAAFSQGLPQRASLREMLTTRWAAMEALRLYPPAPALARTVVTSFSFAGYAIPQGDTCLVANTVTHYLPEFFPDPHRFDVQRYSPDRREHTQSNAYCPYGLGPHTCLGASTADLLFLIINAVLFHHFDLEMHPPDQELRVIMQPLPSPDEGFRMAITGERNPPARWLTAP